MVFGLSSLRLASSLLIAGTIGFALLGCESEEDNKILSAQMCFNKLGDTPTDAQVDGCMEKISDIDTDGANTLRCSAEFLKGGLTTTKLVTAFDTYGDQPEDQQEAYLLENIALSGTTPLATATAAYTLCAKTKTPGLLYIATLARLGTMIDVNGTGPDYNSRIQSCANTTENCQQTDMGKMVVEMSDSYCKGDAKEQQICIDIASAEAVANGNYALIAAGLMFQISY